MMRLHCCGPGEVVQSLQLHAAASAPLVFDASRRRAYAALLDGSLVACAVDTGAVVCDRLTLQPAHLACCCSSADLILGAW